MSQESRSCPLSLPNRTWSSGVSRFSSSTQNDTRNLRSHSTCSAKEKQVTDEEKKSSEGAEKQVTQMEPLIAAGFGEREVQDLWRYWKAAKPDFQQFVSIAAATSSVSESKSRVEACDLAVKAWNTFGLTDDVSKLSLSRLSLRYCGAFGSEDNARGENVSYAYEKMFAGVEERGWFCEGFSVGFASKRPPMVAIGRRQFVWHTKLGFGPWAVRMHSRGIFLSESVPVWLYNGLYVGDTLHEFLKWTRSVFVGIA